MVAIKSIPLENQVLAILRVNRLQSVTTFHQAPDIAMQLDRPTAEIVRVLAELYATGILCKQSRHGKYEYRLGIGGDRTKGCCCCCNERVFSDDRMFCESCGPAFDGRL
jgi:hypothetical protein